MYIADNRAYEGEKASYSLIFANKKYLTKSRLSKDELHEAIFKLHQLYPHINFTCKTEVDFILDRNNHASVRALVRECEKEIKNLSENSIDEEEYYL